MYIFMLTEILLLRMYSKGEVGMHKGLIRVLVTALFIIIIKSWKQF